MQIYRFGIKRVMDITISLFILIVLLPLFLVIFFILVIEHQGKAFFLQDRPGLHARRFKIFKFKTMTDVCDSKGILLPDNARMTRFGSFIRRWSLDELPQLINVLIGQMSLVGPRPLLFKYIPLYDSEQRKRHDVRPGITGWAQVNGRNSISWAQKFQYDIYYVNHVSFLLDVKILWLTALKVVRREGINQNRLRPMEPFTGNN